MIQLKRIEDGKAYFTDSDDEGYTLNRKISHHGNTEIFSYKKRRYFLYPSSVGIKFAVELTQEMIDLPMSLPKTPLGAEMYTRTIEGVHKSEERGDGTVERWALLASFGKGLASLAIGNSIQNKEIIAFSLVYGWSSRFHTLNKKKTKVSFERNNESVSLFLDYD